VVASVIGEWQIKMKQAFYEQEKKGRLDERPFLL